MHPATLLPFFSTIAGGYAALRLRHRIHALMAFASGIVVATAVVHLLPEAWELAGEDGALGVGIAAVVGFIGFSFIEAFIHQSSFEHAGTLGHVHDSMGTPHDDDHEHPAEVPAQGALPERRPGVIGLLPPISLVLHSALDGLVIGVAFQAGDELGLIVLLAVLFHDFADGMNVATVALEAARGVRVAVAFVILDAIAAPVGGAISALVSIDDPTLGLLLGGFGGVFLAIGAGHLLPESQHRDASRGPTMVALAAGGAAVVLLVRAVAPH
jgi:ZIP family zinc transporter